GGARDGRSDLEDEKRRRAAAGQRTARTKGEGVMRKPALAGVTVAALGLAQPAMSADLPAGPYKSSPLIVPVYDWTGFYIGVNGGYSWGRFSNVPPIPGFAPVPAPPPTNRPLF